MDDDVARLIGLFEDSGVDTTWKVDALLGLRQHRHPSIVPFLTAGTGKPV